MRGNVGFQVSKKAIEELKIKVKSSLDQAEASGGIEARKRLALERIAELADDLSPQSCFERVIAIISVLTHHVRHGGLTDVMVRRLFKEAQGILTLQKVKPSTSQLSFLHGELFQVMSQIQRKNGEHWASAWTQQLGVLYSKKDPVENSPKCPTSKNTKGDR